MRRIFVWAMTFAATLSASRIGAQQAPEPAPLPADPVLEDRQSPADAETQLLEDAGPTPGAVTLSLPQAVRMALEGNFGLLTAAEGVEAARLRYQSARAQFYPQLAPRYVRGEEEHTLSVDARQRLPWTGGSVTATSSLRSHPDAPVPATRTADLDLTLTQPLLRGLGPNATFFDLRNSRRLRVSQERRLRLARQQVAVSVARAFYQVLQQRLLLAVARQSLARSDGLLRASEARLQVGLVSKLDVFRAQLQAAQTSETMVRSEAALQDVLEEFRTLLGRAPSDPLEPESTQLSDDVADTLEPLEILVGRARELRLDLHETRDEVDDARRSASLARQELLPQLDLNLGVARTGQGPGFGSAWRAGDSRVNLSFTASYPLERSSRAANKAVAEIEVNARTRALQQHEWAVESEVRSSVRDLDQIRKSVELQQTAVAVAQQQLRLATLRYQRGLASNFDVVEAEGNLVLARSALVGLLTRHQVALIDLRRVTGALDVDAEFAP
jgi:outer membrane protein